MAYIGIDAYGQRYKVAQGTFEASTSAQTTINIGFKPKFLVIQQGASSTSGVLIYDENVSTTASRFAGSGTNLGSVNLGVTTNNRLYSINDDGFTVNKVGSANVHCLYLAIG